MSFYDYDPDTGLRRGSADWIESQQREATARDDDVPSFTCPVCQAVSYNPDDIKVGYCGRCHDWTGQAAAPASESEQEPPTT